MDRLSAQGRLGALAAAAAFITPSFLAVLAVAAIYVRYSGLAIVQSLFYGIAPAVIAIAAWKLAKLTNRRDRRLWAISLTCRTRLNPWSSNNSTVALINAVIAPEALRAWGVVAVLPLIEQNSDADLSTIRSRVDLLGRYWASRVLHGTGDLDRVRQLSETDSYGWSSDRR